MNITKKLKDLTSCRHKLSHDWKEAMIGENWQLITNEPIEFQEYMVEVQYCKKTTYHFK